MHVWTQLKIVQKAIQYSNVGGHSILLLQVMSRF
jgi:hypothetical protein